MEFWDVFWLILRFILIAGVVALILYLTKREGKRSQNKQLVRMPRAYFWIGCIGLFLCAAILLVIPLVSQVPVPIEWYIVFGLLALVSCCILVASVNWRIEIRGTQFLFSNWLGKKRLYEQKDAVVKKQTVNEYQVKVQGKTIRIDKNFIGVEHFLQAVSASKAAQGNEQDK